MSRPAYEDTHIYDCTDKPDGMYAHPVDETRYIVCHNGRAHDVACPDCDPADPRSAGNQYMVFDPDRQECVWPAEIDA